MFYQLAARRRQEQERFLHQEFMKASRPAAAPAEVFASSQTISAAEKPKMGAKSVEAFP